LFERDGKVYESAMNPDAAADREARAMMACTPTSSAAP